MSNGFSLDLSALPAQGTVVVGFSAGADSTALAHSLSQQLPPQRLVLAHVNHMLRGDEAERDEAAARDFARQYGLRFSVLQVDVAARAAETGMGEEECGRQVRYAFFEQLAPNPEDRIVTAHHAGDVAETILLHLVRGTGLDGLCGIPAQRGKILRPMLHVTREQIERYCSEHRLPYVQDSTNELTEYSRNLVRHEVLPLLRQLNPRVIESICQAAELLAADRDLLQQQAEALLKKAQHPYGLSVSVLCGAPGALQLRAVKLFLERTGCRDLERRHLQAVLTCLQTGGAVDLPHGNTARCAQGVFSLSGNAAPVTFTCPLSLGENRLPNGKTLILEKKSALFIKDGQKINNLYFKKTLDYDTIRKTPAARTRRAGDRFSPAGRSCSKPLKQIFQECGMPPALRQNAVLLELDDRLVWCEGAGPAEGFQVTEHTETVLLITIEENEGDFRYGREQCYDE